ncbi:hypothetical protein TPSD3_10240 [Thioflexithrix psekupsensis]|uniref:Uncharacterized protein n=1 Tax=Thioflexithrix psekupsensis TaxID=1570016 RepID=A0A251X724_9GAMM|nr:hypothetical protein TPSD3_10240 [Thioflexithrix psekupsensis]
MNYLEKIEKLLRPQSNLDFFESVGFQTIGYEIDLKASETYNLNLQGKWIVIYQFFQSRIIILFK